MMAGSFKRNIPNAITAARIVLSAALFFVPAFGVEFYVIFSICFVSDILDGALARLLKCSSQKGARLDGAADFLFIIAVISKLAPVIALPKYAVTAVIFIALIRVITLIINFAKFGRIEVIHSGLNKLSGAGLCVSVLLAGVVDADILYIFCAAACGLAAVDEYFVAVFSDSFNVNRFSFFGLFNK